ncbi:MAG: hypothetical protein AB7V77_01875 [Candidatus Woesearchaeota archaeon]
MRNKLFLIMFLITVVFSSMAFASDENNIQDINVDDTKVHNLSNIYWMGTNSLYEYTNSSFRLYIENNGIDTIKTVVIDANPLNISNAPSGCVILGNIMTCTREIVAIDGQAYLFKLEAPSVLADKSFNVTINTTDDKGFPLTSNLTIDVKNDVSAPTYTLVSPISDHTILKNGTNYNFEINYNEVGSGLKNVTMFYEYFDNLSSSSVDTPLNFSIINLFAGTVNSSHDLIIDKGIWGEYLPYFKYYYNLIDIAGNSNNTNYNWIYLDNDVPKVSSNLPTDGIFFTNKNIEEFNFTVSDNSLTISSNFNPSLNCSLFIDSIYKNSSTFINSIGNKTLSMDLTYLDDGKYPWYVSCEDKAGWNNQSETKYFNLDTKAPIIELDSHSNNAIVNNNTNIIFRIKDYNNVSKIYSVNNLTTNVIYNQYGWVYFTINSNTLNSSDNSITIYANDTLGNSNFSTFNISVDDIIPTITDLTATASGKQITINWNVSEVSNNIVKINGINYDVGTLLTYTDAKDYSTTYYYNVTSCDLVGNCNTSETKNITTGAKPAGGGGSGGSSSSDSDVCVENWNCDEWSLCNFGMQVRTCKDLSNCGTEAYKPTLTQTCKTNTAEVILSTENNIDDNLKEINDDDLIDEASIDDENSKNLITGAVIGDGEGNLDGWIWVGSLVAALGLTVAGFEVYARYFR